ncbi:DUF4349 domain-containing protein [Chryseobacterium chendengshani]|uniref:DUF4349 domain-containing protein n=1 Tax=Chryseobacterium sp. LJ756 TaxID=2864113 RepID=UPI001C643BD9|nr:DUF4349 domain-containing protein [Chryseobacterium sp. LJ756]MBW7674986.1 DUF4349 domain-containing protein [Chryseobacterium sp. LJ756]
MKKYFLLVAVSSTFIMCKKGEATQSSVENMINSADSTVADVSKKVDAVQNSAEAVFDSASIKIKDFEKTKTEVTEKIESTSKTIDSLSDKITNMKLESKIEKKDSSKKNSEKIVVNVPSPKIIKETKVIYKDYPKKDNFETKVSKNKMTKTGLLELIVDDAETAKEIVKDQVQKYDGFIKSENISLNNNDKKIAYLKVKVPIQKFDYLMEDLSQHIGKVENKGIDVSGQDFINNTLCDVEITLYGTDENYMVNDKPQSFGSKSLAAVSSGWSVITSIFLFILPLWPLFLIAGIVYHFYKKKNKNLPGNE